MSVPLKKPTIIIVHGAFHTPEFFTDLSSRLVSSYQVIAPALPSTSTTPALPNFDQDVQTVREVIRHVVEAEGEDCLLVMHSYGGVVGTEAVKGLEYRGKDGVGRGVVGLVYIAALLLQEGESPYVNGAAWEVPRPEDEGSPVTVEDGLGTALDASSLFYNDLSTETAAYWASKLKLQSMAVFGSPLTYAAWRYIPTTYLLCTEDRTVLPVFQEKMVERTEGKVDVLVRLKSSHSPFLSHVDEVEELIRKAAGEKEVAA